MMVKTKNSVFVFCILALYLQNIHAAVPASKQTQDPKQKVRSEESISIAQTDGRSPLEKLYTQTYSKRRDEQLRSIRDSFLPFQLSLAAQPNISGVTRAYWHPHAAQLVTIVEQKPCVYDLATKTAKPFEQPTDGKEDYKWNQIYDDGAVSFEKQNDVADTMVPNCDGTKVAATGVRHIDYREYHRLYEGFFARSRKYNRIKSDPISRIWDIQTGTSVRHFNNKIHTMLWNPADSNAIVYLMGKDALLYSYAKKDDGKKEKELTIKKSHSDAVVCASWSADGSKLATGTQNAAYIWNPTFTWDETADKETRVCKLDGKQTALALNHDGTQLATAAGAEMSVFDTRNGNLLYNLEHPEPIDSLAWNPQHADLISCSMDFPVQGNVMQFSIDANPLFNNLMFAAGNKVTVVDATGKPKINLPHPSKVGCALFNPSGTYIASYANNTAYIWNAVSGQPLFTLSHQRPITSLDWNRNNELVICSNGTIHICNTIDLHSRFTQGNLTAPESVLLFSDQLQQFRASIPGYISYPLQDYARHLGMTTADAARAINTMDPDIRKRFLSLNNISTRQEALNKKDTSVDYLEQAAVLDETLSVLHDTHAIEHVRNKDGISTALEEYIVRARTVDPGREELKFREQIYLNPQFRQETNNRLGAAIDAQNMDEVRKHLNSISLNDPSANNNNRTPLMQAIWICNPAQQKENELFKALLNFKGGYCMPDSVNLAATDSSNNTALMLAVEKKCFNLALHIAQKMDQDTAFHFVFAHKKETACAYDLATKDAKQHENDPDYQALMQILKKHADGMLVAQTPGQQWHAARKQLLPLKPQSRCKIAHENPVISAILHPNGTDCITLHEYGAYIVHREGDDSFRLYPRNKTKGFEDCPIVPGYFNRYSEQIKNCALSCDGTMLATVSARSMTFTTYNFTGDPTRHNVNGGGYHGDDLIIRFWDTKTGVELDPHRNHKMQLPDSFWSVHDKTPPVLLWNPCIPGTLALIRNGRVYIHEELLGKPKATHCLGKAVTNWYSMVPDRPDIQSAFWSHDGTQIIASTNQSIQIWDARDGQIFTEFPAKPNSVASLNHADDVIAIASGTDLCVWDIAHKDLKVKFTHHTPIHSLVWNQNKEIACAAGNTVTVVDTATGKPKFNLPHQGKVHHAAYSHDGTQIATTCGDTNAYVWDGSTGDLLYVLAHQAKINSAHWDPATLQLITGSDDKTACIWDMSSYKPFIEGAVSPDQNKLLTTDACKNFRKKNPSYIQYPLKTLARHMKTSVHQLAQTLLSVHPDVRNNFLTYNGISTAKPNDGGCQADYLESQKALQEAQSVVFAHAHEAMTPKQGVDAAKDVLAEYVVEELPPVGVQSAMEDLADETQRYFHAKFREDTKKTLFAAIDANDPAAVEHALNPLSAQERNAYDQTPLLFAMAHYDSKNPASHVIVERLLNYESTLTFKTSKHETREELRVADLAATDWNNNTPLIAAIDKNCFNVALRIAQKMDSDPSLHRSFAQLREHNNVLESAYEIAIRTKEWNKDNPDYQALMQLLEKHRMSKYLLSGAQVMPDQPKKRSAFEKLYTHIFPHGHAAFWSTITDFPPLKVKPIMKITHAQPIKSLCWLKDGMLVSLSGNKDNKGELEDKVHFWDQAGKEYHVIPSPKTKRTVLNWAGQPLDIMERCVFIDGITCDASGTQLTLLKKRKMHTLDEDPNNFKPQAAGWKYATETYATNPVKSLETEEGASADALSEALGNKKEIAPASWNYKAMSIGNDITYTNVLIRDKETNRSLYYLADQCNMSIIAWNHDGTKVAMPSNDGKSVLIWDLSAYNDFVRGMPEQVAALKLLVEQRAEFRKTYPAVPCSLAYCVRQVQKLGITPTALMKFLATVPGQVLAQFFDRYNISTKRHPANSIEEEQGYNDSCTAATQAGKIVTAHESDTQRTTAVADILNDFIVQENYQDSYTAFDTARQLVVAGEKDPQRACDIESVLAEYVVAEHHPEDMHIEAEKEKTRIYRNEQFRQSTKAALAWAIARFNMQDFNEALNPVSVGDMHQYKTPLMQAVINYSQNEEMVQRLLDYQGRLVIDKTRQDMRKSDLVAVDDLGKTALEHALDLKHLHLAAKIMSKMRADGSLDLVKQKLLGNPIFKVLLDMAHVFGTVNKESAQL